jgi:hypothetical protein
VPSAAAGCPAADLQHRCQLKRAPATLWSRYPRYPLPARSQPRWARLRCRLQLRPGCGAGLVRRHPVKYRPNQRIVLAVVGVPVAEIAGVLAVEGLNVGCLPLSTGMSVGLRRCSACKSQSGSYGDDSGDLGAEQSTRVQRQLRESGTWREACPPRLRAQTRGKS